jgi:hypothetical protein
MCCNPERVNLHHENLTYNIGQFYTTEKHAVIKCIFYCNFKGQFLFIYRDKYIFIIVWGELWVTLKQYELFQRVC